MKNLDESMNSTIFMNRTELGSVTYWRAPDERPPQRFYVAFCLLMSSIQDCVLGNKEREQENLNWSATCSYYSLVHAGRFLSFLALGDFPKSHDRLRKLMSASEPPGRSFSIYGDGYPFDWLRGFTRVSELRARSGNEKVPSISLTLHGLRQMVIQYLEEIGVDDSVQRLDQFGELISKAGPLRNDSNYEALLIAHEYKHHVMSSAFQRLAYQMSRAAELMLPFAIDVFNCFFERDPLIPEDRSEYKSFLLNYLDKRIVEAIHSKIKGSTESERILDRLVDLIKSSETDAVYFDIERRISVGIFGEKAGLMQDFKSKIEQLAQVVTNNKSEIL